MLPTLPIRPRSSFLLVALAGCGTEPARKPPPAAVESPASNEPAPPPDSLVLRLSGGREIWYTLAREDQDTAGAACLERILEIRSQDTRIPVPLLYTGDIPRLINESTVSARIWNHCKPGDEYRINLRTGHPVRAPK